MTRPWSHAITFLVLSGLSIYLATDLAAHQRAAGFHGKVGAVSLLLGFTVGLLVVVVVSICNVWWRRVLESTCIDDQFSRAPVNQMPQVNSMFQMAVMDEIGNPTEGGKNRRWWTDGCIEEFVMDVDPSLQEWSERIQP